MTKRRGFGRVYHPKYRDRKTGQLKESPTWWIGYHFRGTEHRESAHSTNRVEALGLLRRRMEEMGRGRLVGPSAERVTFADLKTMLTSEYQTNGRKSLKRAEVALKALEGFFGLFRALDITTDRITEYIRQRQEAGIKPATIRYDLSILKRMFTLAIRAEKLDRKPYIPSIEVRNVRTGFFSETEFQALLSHLPEQVKPVVEFLWLTGWRKTEGLTLEWRQVDWNAKTVRLEPGTTKNDEGRTFPFGNYPELERYKILELCSILNGLPSGQRCTIRSSSYVIPELYANGRQQRPGRGNFQLVVVPRGVMELTVRLDHRKHHAPGFEVAVAATDRAE